MTPASAWLLYAGSSFWDVTGSHPQSAASTKQASKHQGCDRESPNQQQAPRDSRLRREGPLPSCCMHAWGSRLYRGARESSTCCMQHQELGAGVCLQGHPCMEKSRNTGPKTTARELRILPHLGDPGSRGQRPWVRGRGSRPSATCGSTLGADMLHPERGARALPAASSRAPGAGVRGRRRFGPRERTRDGGEARRSETRRTR